jgi:hypothetical protein
MLSRLLRFVGRVKRPASTRSILLVICALASLAAAIVHLSVRGEEPFEYRFRNLKIGMDLREAEALLGPAIETDWCPGLGNGSMVHGEKYYHWQKSPGDTVGPAIWVGVNGNRIVDKYLWWPSL